MKTAPIPVTVARLAMRTCLCWYFTSATEVATVLSIAMRTAPIPVTVVLRKGDESMRNQN